MDVGMKQKRHVGSRGFVSMLTLHILCRSTAAIEDRALPGDVKMSLDSHGNWGL